MARAIGKAEKDTLTVVSSTVTYLTKTIEVYEKINKPKSMIKWLKMATSFLKKVIDESVVDLAPDVKLALIRHAKSMNLVCRTTERIQLDMRDKRNHDTHVPLENERFLVLCSFAYTACKTCTKMDYSDCLLRSIFIEFDIEPVNMESDKCHFMHSDLKENAYMNLEENITTGQLFRVQPGLVIQNFKRVKSSPLSKEYWNLPKITANT